MASSIPEPIVDRLNSLAKFYSRELFDRAYQILRQKKYRNKGELLESLKVTWFKATDKHPPRILLIYLDYADIFEQRTLSWVNVPPVEDLIEWVRSRGLEKKGKIPGYSAYSNMGISDFKKAERIGWAIAMDKRQNDTHKKRPWKRKTLSQMLRDMNDEVHEAFRKETEVLMSNSIEGKKIK